MNTPLIASLLLLFSLVLPWTITYGTNTYGTVVEEFRIFEFPFMVYYVMTYEPQGSVPIWEFYQSGIKYLGTALVLLGGILALLGSLKMKRESFVKGGGALSLVGMVLFSGSRYAEIFIPYTLIQEYTSYPVGMFIPVVFWFLILYRHDGNVQYARKTPFKQREIFCGECGRRISLDMEVCPFCGAATGRTTCQKCRRRISTQYVYCPFCGVKR
jgi:RNA polymerase subunit RPABC4/transcription elongation factor Spt4/uncharacterized membrane protein YgdD (TMEM256/DUF423 family)